jgi:hypothetical protein
MAVANLSQKERMPRYLATPEQTRLNLPGSVGIAINFLVIIKYIFHLSFSCRGDIDFY